MKSFILEKKKEIIIFFIFSLSIFLITFQFTETPVVWMDEGVYTETAKNLALHGVLGIQTEPGKFFIMNSFLLSANYPVIFPVALSFKIFGVGVWQARLPMIIYMFLLVLVFFIFTKKRYGFYPAILSTFFLLSFSPFYGNGRPVQGEVCGLFFMILGAILLSLFESSQYKNKKWVILSGLSFGLAMVVKPLYLIVLTVALFLTFIIWIKKIKSFLKLFLLGLFPPIILLAYIEFPTIQLFKKTISNFIVLGSHSTESVSMFQIVLNNFSRFYKESTPILFILLLVSTVLFFIFSNKKTEINENMNTFSISEYILLFFIIINWVLYLFGTGWYRYFFPAHVLLYLFFPISMITFSALIKNNIIKKVLLIFPIILLILQFYHLVYLSDTSFVVERKRNTELAEVFSKIDISKKVLFYGETEAIIFLKGYNYSHYLSISSVLDTGNKDIYQNNSFDYIFSRRDLIEESKIKCFKKENVDKYFLFTKKVDCK